MDAIKVKLIGLSRGGGGNLQPDKTATPTEQDQTVRPDPGYDGLRQVTVEAIPDQYADVSGVNAGAGDVRIGKTIVGSDGETITGTMPPQKPEQSKTVIPMKETQTVEPDEGYALSAVEVDAIPDEYANISGVTADANKVKSGYVFVNSEGVETQGTNTDDADTSDGTMSASQLEADAVGYSQGQRIVGTKPIRTTDVEISDLLPVPIPAGSYDGTAVAKLSSAAAANVVASNIRQGAEILGVQGSYHGADNLVAVNDNALTEYTSNDITTVRKYMFVDATSLERVNIPNAVSIGDYAFQGCTSLSDINFPNVETIGVGAFERIAVEHISLPSLRSVTGGVVFSNSSATTADFPNLETIVSSLVPYCQNLVSINVPKLTAVKESTFVECRSLTSINLPSVLTVSNNYGFLRCSALQLIDFGAVTSISGTAVFHYCSSLTTIIIRTGAVCTLNDINKLNATPFASNGTGGTLYVPQAQIANYQSATNWSVILAYANNQILPIEGSPYEVTT